MPTPPAASDVDVLARIARGDHDAVELLVDRHADTVHDHVARWTGDARVAADATTAAFVSLLDDVIAGTPPSAVVPSLLHAARTTALRVLHDDEVPASPLPPPVLAAAGTTGTDASAARAAWRTATGLGPPTFSVLDLHLRHGLEGHDLGSVLDLTTDTVADLLTDVRARVDESTRAAYAGLATLRAPVATRTAIRNAATQRLGRPGPTAATLGTRVALATAGLAVLVTGVALGGTFNRTPATPTSGPATAAAEAVPSPSPDEEPTPTATLEPRPSPSIVPMASPEPTVPTSPTPSPSPQPSPTPSPTPEPTPSPTVLAVTVDGPPSGSTFDATGQDGDRQVATVPVAATVTGGSDGTSVSWVSSVAPDDVLLEGTAGDVVLALQEPCVDTAHTLTVTATDDATGQTAQASVDVLLTETCEEPLMVEILAPSSGERIEGTRTRDGAHTASVEVAANANDDDLEWTWSVTGATLVGDPLKSPGGTLQLRIEGCTLEQDVSISVEVLRPADESTAEAGPVTITVTCPIG